MPRPLIALTRGGVLDTDLGQALSYSRDAAGLALEHGPELAVAALATLAYAHYLAGDAARARSTADQALNRPEAAQRPHGVVYAHAVHALLECDAGRVQVAEKEALHAVARARNLGIGGTWSAGLARHALGEALLASGHPREAERELSRAVTLRQAGEPRLDTVALAIQLARARVACGKLAAAASDLDAVHQLLSAFSDAGRLPGMASEVTQALETARPGLAASWSSRRARPSSRFCSCWTPTCLCARSRRNSACRLAPYRRTFAESTPSSGRTLAKKRSRRARREGLIGDTAHVAESASRWTGDGLRRRPLPALGRHADQ